MKLKRKYSWSFALSMIPIIFIPTCTYIVLKMSSMVIIHEWIWWIFIPFVSVLFILINFKITKR